MRTQQIIAISLLVLASSAPAQSPTATPTATIPLVRRPPARNLPSPGSATVDVLDVIKEFASLTHLKVIRDNFVQGKIAIDDLAGLPPEKAIQIIERTLFADGFSITQVDPDTVEVCGAGRNARALGVPVVNYAKEIPGQERLVSFVFHFKYRSAEEMQKVFYQHVAPPQTYTRFVAEPKGNTLLITERTSVVRRLIEIAAKMDVPDWKKEP